MNGNTIHDLREWLQQEIELVERKWGDCIAAGLPVDVRKCGRLNGERDALKRVLEKVKDAAWTR